MSFKRAGYTHDGLVFVVFEGLFRDQAVESISQMAPSEAENLGQALIVAAQKAKENGRNRANPD
jgi:hypothetical protein